MGGERLFDEEMKWLPILGLLEHLNYFLSGDDPDTGIGMCGWLLTTISWFLLIITLPFFICECLKVWDDKIGYCSDHISAEIPAFILHA